MARIARLKGKHLEVRGERVIGAGEPAVLHVVSRNMPALKVKVYKLGLEDYFRRKHTVGGVENVQVEIVKPDLTAEWKLDPYAPFALTTADRAVPTAGPGAYVVVVSDDDLTSTTLLVVSDVEAIVKASAGRQVFVWARNRAKGLPEAGARVLVSTGTAILAEGVTDKDGVYVLDTAESARRVLVLAGAHAAASEWEPGQTFSEGWQTKVHVATDRPVYRPGQTVKWRGIFRRASGGGYAVPSGIEAQAVLVDARGAEVGAREGRLLGGRGSSTASSRSTARRRSATGTSASTWTTRRSRARSASSSSRSPSSRWSWCRASPPTPRGRR